MASIFLHAESDRPEHKVHFKKLAFRSNIIAIILGALIFILGFGHESSMTFYFLRSPISLTVLVIATLLIPVQWVALNKNSRVVIQGLGSIQMLLITLGVFWPKFPIVLQTNLDLQPRTYTFYNSVSEQTNQLILFAVTVVATIVSIMLYLYLIKVYKKKFLAKNSSATKKL